MNLIKYTKTINIKYFANLFSEQVPELWVIEKRCNYDFSIYIILENYFNIRQPMAEHSHVICSLGEAINDLSSREVELLFLYRRHLNEFEYLSYLSSTVIGTDDSVLTEGVCRIQRPYSGIDLGLRITTDFMELFVKANGLNADDNLVIMF